MRERLVVILKKNGRGTDGTYGQRALRLRTGCAFLVRLARGLLIRLRARWQHKVARLLRFFQATD